MNKRVLQRIKINKVRKIKFWKIYMVYKNNNKELL